MTATNSNSEGNNYNFSSPFLKALLSSQNIYLLTFDINGQILDYSEGLKSLFEVENEFYVGKNIESLSLSKSEKPLILLNFKKGFSTSQKIYDVKFVTGQGRILTMNLSIELSFSKEKLTGGVIHFETGKQNLQSQNGFNNLLSKSKFFLKEPLRISKLFAEKLGERITNQEPTKKEYLNFIIDNISSLNYLVNDLIILENLNAYHLDLQDNNFEEIVIIGVQESKGSDVEILKKAMPQQVYCDRSMMKLLLKTMIKFSEFYPSMSPNYVKIEGTNLEKVTNIIFKMRDVSFLDHPSFAPNRSLKRISNLQTSNTSGYELVIIDQIVKLHNGLLKISINDQSETEIEINLPKK